MPYDLRTARPSGERSSPDFARLPTSWKATRTFPHPNNTDVLVFPPSAPDAEKRREIDVIASRIGSVAETFSAYRHYQTSRRFGPVEYRAVAIPPDENTEQ